MRELAKTPAGKARIDKAEERITKALVEMSGDVDGKWPSQTRTSAAAPPGFSGTAAAEVREPLRDTSTPGMDPAAVPSTREWARRRDAEKPHEEVSTRHSAAEFTLAGDGQGDGERREGFPHPRDAQVHVGEAEQASEMDMGFMDKDEITIFLI